MDRKQKLEQQWIEWIREERPEADQALQQIYLDSRGPIGALVKRNKGTEEEAKDVMQEAMIAFYENVKKEVFKGESAISTYLYSIARFIWLNRLKRKNLEFEKQALVVKAEPEPALPKRIEDQESRQQMLHLFAKLGADCQEVLMASIYHGLNMKDIAKRMAYDNEQVARNKKYICLKKLKEIIKDYPTIFQHFVL